MVLKRARYSRGVRENLREKTLRICSSERKPARNATVYAELAGYGLSCDANHMTAPQGDGAVRAMQTAMRDADLTPDQIDYISAHGTGTPANDRVETIAVKQAFGAAAPRVPISSIKSMLGHTMGAASAIEAAACALAVLLRDDRPHRLTRLHQPIVGHDPARRRKR